MQVRNEAVVLARERRVQSEENEATVPNDVPVPERDLEKWKEIKTNKEKAKVVVLKGEMNIK